jgi:hypothetical protein
MIIRRFGVPVGRFFVVGEIHLAAIPVGRGETDVAGIGHAARCEPEIEIILGRINTDPRRQPTKHVIEHRKRIVDRNRPTLQSLANVGFVGMQRRRQRRILRPRHAATRNQERRNEDAYPPHHSFGNSKPICR